MRPVITLPRYYLKYHRIRMMSRTTVLDDAIKWEILQVILVRVWIGMLTFSGENTKPQVKMLNVSSVRYCWFVEIWLDNFHKWSRNNIHWSICVFHKIYNVIKFCLFFLRCIHKMSVMLQASCSERNMIK